MVYIGSSLINEHLNCNENIISSLLGYLRPIYLVIMAYLLFQGLGWKPKDICTKLCKEEIRALNMSKTKVIAAEVDGGHSILHHRHLKVISMAGNETRG